MININIFKSDLWEINISLSFIVVWLYSTYIHCCIPMSKPTENNAHLWIGASNYLRGCVDNFSLFKKGEVPYGRQSLVGMQKLYMIYGYRASISNT